MDFPLYFQKVMLLWQRSIVVIDYGFFRVFGPREVPELENLHFLFYAFPQVQNQFWKQFSNKVLYNYCLKKKFEGFG